MASGFLDELLAPYSGAPSQPEENAPVYRMLYPLIAARRSGAGQRGGLDDLAGGGPKPVGDVESLVKRMAARKYGWTGDQWSALHDLIMKESGFNPKADNPTSSAYGIFQFLDSTRENYGLPLHAGPRGQTKAGLKYILDRYGNPRNALNFHLDNNWY